ncbi:MAG TPA: class F sortase [Marmoricola sp.]|jgi:hypothetical protein|nr:class F sortase [Marmoricola sp.]
MSATTRRRTAQVAVVVGALILLVWLLLDPHPIDDGTRPTTPAAQAMTAGDVLKPKPCYRGATAPFTPTRITVPGVTRNATVLALPRDANNVPEAPPISDVGKTQFAWAVAPDPKPGSDRGNALFNAHTWPDGTALGNKLLDGLQVGDKIIVHGHLRGTPQTLCYRVTKRDVIVASDGSFEYYEREGPPQLALIVCSPPRLGPGNWLHRTIWYASPMAS